MTSTARLSSGRVPEKRSRWRRIGRFVLYFMALILTFYCVTIWFSRSVTATVDLGAVDRVVVVVESGSVTVMGSDDQPSALATVDQSWSWRSPQIEQGVSSQGALIRVSCPSVTPCRTDVALAVSPETEVTVIAPDGDVLASRLDAAVTIQSGRSVALGPLGGTARVVVPKGSLTGRGLRLRELQVRSGGDPIDLDYSVAPDQLSVRATDGRVDLAMPDQVTYVLDVPEGSEVATEFGASDTGTRDIVIETGGPVAVAVHQPPERN